MNRVIDVDASVAAVDAIGDLFRQSMRRLASAVSIVACESDGEWFGLSATSVTSLSMEPPSLLVCLNSTASLTPMMIEGKSFSVNLLDRRHQHVSNVFGSSSLRAERFRDGGWELSERGVPVMAEAVASVECDVGRLIEYGSHIIVIGEVRHVRIGEGVDPLIYCNGKYQ